VLSFGTGNIVPSICCEEEEEAEEEDISNCFKLNYGTRGRIYLIIVRLFILVIGQKGLVVGTPVSIRMDLVSSFSP
jgi:hypothetical protein